MQYDMSLKITLKGYDDVLKGLYNIYLDFKRKHISWSTKNRNYLPMINVKNSIKYAYFLFGISHDQSINQ